LKDTKIKRLNSAILNPNSEVTTPQYPLPKQKKSHSLSYEINLLILFSLSAKTAKQAIKTANFFMQNFSVLAVFSKNRKLSCKRGKSDR
jgi:hypothetical protein